MSRVAPVDASQAQQDSGDQGRDLIVVGRTSISDFCHIPICIEGVPCTALVDTGSTVTVVQPEVVPQGVQLEDTAVQLRTVTGELAPMKGRGLLRVTVGGRTMKHPVWVAEVQDSCILGLDFLRDNSCQLDLSKATQSFSDGQVVNMKPLDPQHMSVLTAGPHTRFVGESIQGGQGATLSKAPSASQSGAERVTRPPATPACTTWPVTAAPGCCKDMPGQEVKRRKALHEVWQRSADDLDARQQEQLWQLLMEFRDCFSCEEEELGQTSLVQHSIDTGTASPIRERPRRLPLGRQKRQSRL